VNSGTYPARNRFRRRGRTIAELAGVIDVAPLAGKPGLVIEVDDGQERRNTDLLDPTARIRRL
jgi:hypothetical protein